MADCSKTYIRVGGILVVHDLHNLKSSNVRSGDEAASDFFKAKAEIRRAHTSGFGTLGKLPSLRWMSSHWVDSPSARL